MPENNSDEAVAEFDRHCDPACIHTKRILDSCLDKDCVEDLRVYLTRESQAILNRSSSARVRNAELLYVYLDVEPIIYKSGHYSIDLTFYYRITAEAVSGTSKPALLQGLSVFSKRVILYGGSGSAKIFTSQTALGNLDRETILSSDVPTAVVEIVDPMVLSSKVRDVCDCRPECEAPSVPGAISDCFDEDLALTGETKRLYVTIGQFSTVRLERDAQLRMPTLEYCIPDKECCDDACPEEDPCEMFGKISFPTEAFFPTGRSGCNSN